MTHKMRPLPEKWGDDLLSGYFDKFQTNQYATFQKKTAEFERLRRIDELFFRVTENLVDPEDQLGALLLLRAHASYRAAGAIVTAGSCAECFVVLRQCVETAAYAVYINRDPNPHSLRDIWLKRAEGPDELKACRAAFTYGKYSKVLAVVDAKLANTYSILYERAIDFGAHPNEGALASNMKIEKSKGITKMLQIYLHGHGLQLDHALKTSAQTGVCAIALFGHIFPKRYKKLDLANELAELQRHL